MTELVKFRWHKGGFEESLRTVTIQPYDDMVKMILDKSGAVDGTIESDYQAIDSREGWNDASYLITINGNVVGHSNKPLGISRRNGGIKNEMLSNRLH